MEDTRVSILITSGVGIKGVLHVPGDVVPVTSKTAALIKALGRAVDATKESMAEWNAMHRPEAPLEAPAKKSKKSGD